MIKLIEVRCLVKIIYITLPSVFWIFESHFSLHFQNRSSPQLPPSFSLERYRIMCKLGSERIEKEMTWAITRQDFVITWRNLRRFHITLRVLFLAKFALGMLSFNMNSIFEEKEIKSAFGWLFSFLIYNQTGVSGSCDQDRMSLSWFLSVTCQNGRLGLN